MIFGLSWRDGSVVKSGWVLGTELQSSVRATTFIAYELITGYNSGSWDSFNNLIVGHTHGSQTGWQTGKRLIQVLKKINGKAVLFLI